jgi:hypothetical protein
VGVERLASPGPHSVRSATPTAPLHAPGPINCGPRTSSRPSLRCSLLSVQYIVLQAAREPFEEGWKGEGLGRLVWCSWPWDFSEILGVVSFYMLV